MRIALGDPDGDVCVPKPRVEIIQTSCKGSYATAGSLIRAQGPPSNCVVPGRTPVTQWRPPSVEVDQAMLLAPPPLT